MTGLRKNRYKVIAKYARATLVPDSKMLTIEPMQDPHPLPLERLILHIPNLL